MQATKIEKLVIRLFCLILPIRTTENAERRVRRIYISIVEIYLNKKPNLEIKPDILLWP